MEKKKERKKERKKEELVEFVSNASQKKYARAAFSTEK
jgi:hypothetical protein